MVNSNSINDRRQNLQTESFKISNIFFNVSSLFKAVTNEDKEADGAFKSDFEKYFKDSQCHCLNLNWKKMKFIIFN